MDKTLQILDDAVAEQKPQPRPGPAASARLGVAPIEVGLTTFIDFILKSGTSKLTVVKKAKRQNERDYDPMEDFYRILREGVAAFHRKGKDKQALNAIMAKIKSDAKLNAYPDFIGGYKKFIGRKSFGWFTPPKGVWAYGGLVVRANPELGLELNGQMMAVKMFLRTGEDMNKRRAALITHVMQLVHAANHPGMSMCVLDVKNGKNYPCSAFDPDLSPVLRGEALSFVEMYRSL